MTAQQHADVMDKVGIFVVQQFHFQRLPFVCSQVNNLNVFMESNKVLREEKNVLAKQIDELKEKVTNAYRWPKGVAGGTTPLSSDKAAGRRNQSADGVKQGADCSARPSLGRKDGVEERGV